MKYQRVTNEAAPKKRKLKCSKGEEKVFIVKEKKYPIGCRMNLWGRRYLFNKWVVPTITWIKHKLKMIPGQTLIRRAKVKIKITCTLWNKILRDAQYNSNYQIKIIN